MAASGNKSRRSVDGQCWSAEEVGSRENGLNREDMLVNGAARSSCIKCVMRWVSDNSCARVSFKRFSASSLWILLLLLITVLTVDYVDAHTKRQINENYSNHPTEEFSTHFIIKPQIHHGRHKRALASTLEEEGLHATHITLSYQHNGRNIVADLQLNEDLIPRGHFLRYQKADGGTIVQNFTQTLVELCHYQGTIRGSPKSRVAVSTCNGVNGIVRDGDDTYFIYSDPDGKLHDDHYLFRNSDRIHNATCGFENNFHSFNVDNNLQQSSEFNRILRYKRSNSDDVIRGPYNANRHSSFVELVMVVDNKVYQSFGENMKKVHNHCKDIANIVNALYVPLNIFIALVGVVVWNESNEIELSKDGDVTLKNFLHYRRKVLVQNHPNDNAQLLTKEQFEGGVVGKALKGPICTYEYSGGVSMEHSQTVAVVAATVAHEMGHNFGMEHDTADCKCVEEKCIMSASSTSVVPSHWSACSIDQLNVAFSHGMNYCLRNKPAKLFDSPQCGNGFVEAGEQCDCGLPKSCENTCCDPNTCMLNANASCATGKCCDLTTCRPKTAGTECRSAEGECDLPEYCTGESEYCPTDVYKRDTIECDNKNAFCYQGSCRSRTNQCKILWGPSGESSDHCYEKNVEGSRHGNCGYDRIDNHYRKCLTEDVYCGMLHCKHLNERLEFGMESVAVLSHSFMNHEGTIIPCRAAIVDLGLQTTDPGLAPNGAKCGNDSMCVDQKCVSVKNLRSSGMGVDCPDNCNNQGTCNSKGHCHCDIGFSPPDCSSPGQGGSIDSGPATDPNSRRGFTRAMYIFFLGVVPLVSIICLFSYYYKHIRPMNSRKPTNVSKPSIKTSPSRGSTSPPGMPTSTPSSTDDMNSALLKSPTDESIMNNGMFGKFKGFTLRPLPNSTGATNIGGPNVALVHPVAKSFELPNGVPIRLAPPVPKPPIMSLHKQQGDATQKMNGTLPFGIKSSSQFTNNITSATAPALPPPNPGFNNRPIISNPVLETSTCTAKELISPLKQNASAVPVRAAPVAPVTLPSAETRETKVHFASTVEKKPKDGTIKRIASFLKKEEKVDPNAGQKHPLKIKPIIDREKLKNIEISAPIPVVDPNSDSEDEKQIVARTQSMRDPSPLTKKPNIQSFGSMRNPPGVSRPKSIVGLRPKSPPPRPPAPASGTNNAVNSGYQKPPEPKLFTPKKIQNEYDDCEAVEEPLAHISEENSPESDNIYSVIEERPPPLPKYNSLLSPPKTNTISGSNDSMGLLGEIVNEIEKRNGDSIYSASTLKKKKSDGPAPYANTSEVNDYSEAEYLKSNGSTTSSGYLRPSSINTPVARVAPTRPDQASSSNNSNLSSFRPKTFKSHKKVKDEPGPPTGPISKLNTTPTSPVGSRKIGVSRTKTPPSINNSSSKSSAESIRRRSPSPSKSVTSNKTKSNSAKQNAQSDTKSANNTEGVAKRFNKTAATETNSSAAQKPKLLSKPSVSGKTASATTINSGNSEINPKVGRQGVSLSDTTNKAFTSANKKLRSIEYTPPHRKSSLSKTDDSLTSNSNSINGSNNKNLSSAIRPTLPGKISNVASLQQRFESGTGGSGKPPSSSSSSSFSNSSSSTVKK